MCTRVALGCAQASTEEARCQCHARAVSTRQVRRTTGRPELSDLGRYGRMLVRTSSAQARAAELPTFRSLIADHLGAPGRRAGGRRGVLAGVRARQRPGRPRCLARRARTSHRLVGLADYRHRGSFGLADLLGQDRREPRFHGPRPGNVTRVSLPSGPAGETRECLRAAFCSPRTDRTGSRYCSAVRTPRATSAAWRSRPSPAGTASPPQLTAAAARAGARAQRATAARSCRSAAACSASAAPCCASTSAPGAPTTDLILPAETFADVRRRSSEWPATASGCARSGQHLKRGLLLYGPPGVGKTHTVRYLSASWSAPRSWSSTGETLGAIREACSIARSLQPSMIVVEDVDLIAAGARPLRRRDAAAVHAPQRDGRPGRGRRRGLPAHHQPGRPARAGARLAPGRVDQAVHIDLPDREARRRLVELYRGSARPRPRAASTSPRPHRRRDGVVPQGAAAPGRGRGRRPRRRRRTPTPRCPCPPTTSTPRSRSSSTPATR